MYYLLALLLFLVLYYVFVKLLSSILKGCLAAVLGVFLFFAISALIKSKTEPVYVFNMYKIENFEVTKIK